MNATAPTIESLPPEAYASLTDDEVMARLNAGDVEPSLTELRRRHGARIYRLVRSIVRDAHLAEDVCQDVFTKVFLKSHLYQPDSRFRAWISEVARNQALSALRARRIAPRPLSALAGPDEEFDLEERMHRGDVAYEERIAEERELMNAFEEALDDLPEHNREVFELCVRRGMEYGQAARLLGIPTGTVAIRIMRARKRLYRALQDHIGHLRRPPACFVN